MLLCYWLYCKFLWLCNLIHPPRFPHNQGCFTTHIFRTPWPRVSRFPSPLNNTIYLITYIRTRGPSDSWAFGLTGPFKIISQYFGLAGLRTGGPSDWRALGLAGTFWYFYPLVRRPTSSKKNLIFFCRFGLAGLRTSGLRTDGPSDSWAFGLAGLRTRGPSDSWAFGLADRNRYFWQFNEEKKYFDSFV